MRTELVIAPAEDGKRLGDVLRARGYSRRLAVKLKHTEGGMTRLGVTVRTIDTVRAGEVILLCCEEQSMIEANDELAVPVIYEDSELVVFDKPSAMPVHPSMRHRTDTLANLFSARYPGTVFRAVSRLDRDTSGCVPAARSQLAASVLSGRIEKSYLAVCCGVPPKNGRVTAPIAREQGSVIKRCGREDGRYAETVYEVLSSDGKYSLCRVVPLTGRTHQIRVHFAYMGCPLAGDDLYGGSREDIGRQALHCAEICFVSPADGERHRVSSPLPEDMRRLVRRGL